MTVCIMLPITMQKLTLKNSVASKNYYPNFEKKAFSSRHYLVAPVVTSDDQRTVMLHQGEWRDERGEVFQGGKIVSIQADIDRLLYFEKIK